MQDDPDDVKTAVIESFKFVEVPHLTEVVGKDNIKEVIEYNQIKIDDICYRNGDYKNLSPAVRPI